jgi:enoyl-CoA hydratase
VRGRKPAETFLAAAAMTGPGHQTLRLERVGDHVLLVILNRPDARNALNTQMGLELRELWRELYVDGGELRCIVLTGAGDKAFCAGADLKERRGMAQREWRRQHAIFEQMIQAQIACPLPVIAAVNGAAFAGGLEMVAAADFAYAAEGARFALTEVSLGIIPGAMGTQTLPRAVGVRRAKEIVLTALPFDAADALAWGLVNRVFASQDALREGALATAARIAANAPLSVRQAKRALSVAPDVDLATGYAFELEAYNRTIVTEDREEGIRAFNEKRPPVFKGR